jgi:hypothetical protein
MVETLFLDGSDKPLRVRIEVGATRRQFHGFHTSGFEDTLKLRRNSAFLQCNLVSSHPSWSRPRRSAS